MAALRLLTDRPKTVVGDVELQGCEVRATRRQNFGQPHAAVGSDVATADIEKFQSLRSQKNFFYKKTEKDFIFYRRLMFYA